MIALKLALVHLIGDFFLQPNSWVESKERRKIRSRFIYYHIAIHVGLSYLFLWNTEYWFLPIIVGVTHFLIDLSKLYFQTIKSKRGWFFLDQFLHFLVIGGIGYYYAELDFNAWWNLEILKYIVALAFLAMPTSIIIKNLLTVWTPNISEQTSLQTDSLANAGQYIGILERFLVFAFVALDHWEGVGFMIAAKSVFRFSDLAQAKQRKLTEYVLIGTLLSFGIAIMTGVLINL